jgi:hypothetical protein
MQRRKPPAEVEMLDLCAVAYALGGEVSGVQVLAPGPGHSDRDRSLSVRVSSDAPDGFLAYSHSGDDWKACRDHICDKIGIERRDWSRVGPKPGPRGPREREQKNQGVPSTHFLQGVGHDDAKRIADAIASFREGVNPCGTLVEDYFAHRHLEIDDLADGVIRWSARSGAMLALFRNIRTGRPQAVSRTFLDPDARKIERKFLGPVGGAAIMLDAFDQVSHGLHVGEGLESCQAARQLGLRPCWALGSAAAVAAFPVLRGVETLTILAEHDDASARATETCGLRWHAAGREVLVTKPYRGKDLNDALRGNDA